MFKKSNKGYYFWEEFARVDGIVHGFSTRSFGDMNTKNPKSNNHLKIFLKSLGTHDKNVVRMSQIHGDNVEVVSNKDSGAMSLETIINNTDGLISSSKGIYLVCTFADCVPVLFLDKERKAFGIVHAGWRGVYKEIVLSLILKMVGLGSNLANILVGIGPAIRICCYSIDKEREKVFKDKYLKWQDIIKRKDDKIFLDLVKIVKLQLKVLGVLDQNIFDCKLCTKDNILDFYSFRKEHRKPSFGLCSGVIGKV